MKLSGGGKVPWSLLRICSRRVTICSLPWIMAYDLYPLQTLETKRAWVPRIVNEGWIVVFGHDPDVAAAATLDERDGSREVEVEPVDLNQ